MNGGFHLIVDVDVKAQGASCALMSSGWNT